MEQAGFTRQQAEAMAEEQARLIDDRLATKTDIERIRVEIETLRKDTVQGTETLRKETAQNIENLRKETTQNIEALRLEMKLQFELVRRDIEVMRRDLTIRAGGIALAAVAAASAIANFFGRLPPPHP